MRALTATGGSTRRTVPIAGVSTIFLRFARGFARVFFGRVRKIQDLRIAIYLHKQGDNGKS